MPKNVFQLASNDSRKVTVSWRGLFKDITVDLEGEQIMQLANKKELQAGRSALLGDGSTLFVGWQTGAMQQGIRIERDGTPLPGSSADPATIVKLAAGILGFICVLNLALGLIAELGDVTFLRHLGIGWASAVVGVLFAGLAYGTHKRSFVALLIGTLLFAADGVYTLWLGVDSGGRVPTGGIVMRVLLIIPLVRAMGPIRLLAKTEADNASARIISG